MTQLPFQTRALPASPDELAPDGSSIRRLCTTGRGSLVHLSLAPGGVSRAVRHRSVEELWYFLTGEGELWRSRGDQAEVVKVTAGIAVSLPAGTAFQFRAAGGVPLTAVCVTMPRWPGPEEAGAVDGPWPPNLLPRVD